MSNSDETMFLVCKDNHIRMIDLNFLKTCEYLRGALIFLRLFNLDESNPFKNLDMHTDENGFFTILKDLYISIHEWDLLIHFLKYGFTLSYNDGSEYKKLEALEQTCHIVNILGGIPSFDEFYIKHHNNIIYNPTTPERDDKKLYNWKIAVPYSVDNNGWDVTKSASHDSNYFYYRKLKE
jgi:hypothetical protein